MYLNCISSPSSSKNQRKNSLMCQEKFVAFFVILQLLLLLLCFSMCASWCQTTRRKTSIWPTFTIVFYKTYITYFMQQNLHRTLSDSSYYYSMKSKVKAPRNLILFTTKLLSTAFEKRTLDFLLTAPAGIASTTVAMLSCHWN